MNNNNNIEVQLPQAPVQTVPVQTVPVQTVPVQTPAPVYTAPAPAQSASPASVLGKEMAEFFALQSATLKNQYIKEQEDENNKAIFNLQGKAGLASANFKAQMLQEIEDGNAIPFYYSPTLAKVRGGHLNFSVSGYTINLTEGTTVMVPNTLRDDLMMFIEGSTSKSLLSTGIQPGDAASRSLAPAEQHFIDNIK